MPELIINGSKPATENIGAVSKACSVLVREYRENEYFREAVIESINSVTADTGLSEAVANRLFDLEEPYEHDCEK